MIANIGPADYNMDETINTLRWASRAKHIQNKPRINEDPKDAMLREFQEEILKLRNLLALNQGGGGGMRGGIPGGPQIMEVSKIVEVKDEQKIKELEERIILEKEQIKREADNERAKIEQMKNLAEDEKLQLMEKI